MTATVIIPDWLMPAEQAVAGYAIGSADQADEVATVLAPGQFTRAAHQVMLSAALSLAAAGDPVDPIAVMEELTRTGEMRALGGRPEYLHTCWQAGRLLAPQWEYHARRILGHWQVTSYRGILATSLSEASQPGFVLAEGTEILRERLDAVENPGAARLKSMGELVAAAMTDLESDLPRGLSSPWRDLDDVIVGLAPGMVCVLGGITGTGKTIVGAQWADHVGRVLRLPVLYASMEMTGDELALRLLSARTTVPLSRMLHRELTEDDWGRLARRQSEVSDSALVIDDTPAMSLASLRSQLRVMARSEDTRARMLVVDYLTLLEEPAGSESRRVAVLRLSLGIRQIAREFRIPVVVLAQLNREYAKRSDKRPQKSDLAESSQIAQDADLVLLLHRPDLHEPEGPQAGVVEVVVDKNRHGPQVVVPLAFQGHYGRVVDLAPDGLSARAPADWSPSGSAASF